LLTGRHAFRTGIGAWIDPTDNRDRTVALSIAEISMPDMLQLAEAGPYYSAIVGKWHLSGFDIPGPEQHPLNSGFQHHRGSLGNPLMAAHRAPMGRGYFHWQKNTDGFLAMSRVYMTTDTADEAIQMIETLPEPWLIWVSFNAPHKPLHRPPDHLHGYELGDDATDAEKYNASVEALDTELGRVLDHLVPEVRDRTTIVFLGDNGTIHAAVEPPWDNNRHKGSLFEAGVQVPLIIDSPHVGIPGSAPLRSFTWSTSSPRSPSSQVSIWTPSRCPPSRASRSGHASTATP
jgi:arylsulfatase A-like enzyme